MDQDNPIDEISRIEARLEELAEVSERCRKIILVSKVASPAASVCCSLWCSAYSDPIQVAAIGSIAVVLGGIVSFGSNVFQRPRRSGAVAWRQACQAIDLESRNFKLNRALLAGFYEPAVIVDHSA